LPDLQKYEVVLDMSWCETTPAAANKGRQLGQQAAGAAQTGAQGAGQQLLAIGAAQTGAQAFGQQAFGAGQQLFIGAQQAGAAGAQQAGAGQQVFGQNAGAAHVLQQPPLCPPKSPPCPPNIPHFEAGAQQDDGQQVSQHGGLMSEQRR